MVEGSVTALFFRITQNAARAAVCVVRGVQGTYVMKDAESSHLKINRPVSSPVFESVWTIGADRLPHRRALRSLTALSRLCGGQSGGPAAEREEDRGPLLSSWEPMLCSEAEEGQAPLSLELLYHSAQTTSPSDALMVAANLLMVETGFVPEVRQQGGVALTR